MLSYNAELELFKGILSQFSLAVNVLPLESGALFGHTLAPRSLQPATDKLPELEMLVREKIRDNVIYHISNEFSCRYALLLLPETESKTVLVIGPYADCERDSDWIAAFAREKGMHPQWQPVLEAYFRGVPCLSDQKLLYACLNSFCERIWGLHRFSSEEIVSGLPQICVPLTSAPDSSYQEDIMFSIKKTEAQYESENQFMLAISQGRSHRAELMLSNFSKAAIENRTEPIRNIKNYSIILNTLMRKAAEQGGVHPMHIDRLSSEFARRIETTALWEQFMELWRDMAKNYCLLVKKHSTKNYSQIVQHIIARIEYDLTADLSLKANARALNVNASYLSTLFKKETGSTMTDYVNRKRIEHAIYLLNTTDLPIATVGQRCGIQDDNYFTKIFKKYTGITPKQFRAEHRHFSASI